MLYKIEFRWGEERGRENTCFPVEEGLGKPWVSQGRCPKFDFVMTNRIFFRSGKLVFVA